MFTHLEILAEQFDTEDTRFLSYISVVTQTYVEYFILKTQQFQYSKLLTKGLAKVSQHATNCASGWPGTRCCCCCYHHCCWRRRWRQRRCCWRRCWQLLCLLLWLLNGTDWIQGPTFLQQEVSLPSYCLRFTQYLCDNGILCVYHTP